MTTVRIEVSVRVDGAEHKVDVPASIFSAANAAPPPDPPPPAASSWLDLAPQKKLSDLVRGIVIDRLAKHEGNRTWAAKSLGISLRGLRNMINEFEAAGHSVPESKHAGYGWARAAHEASGYAGNDRAPHEEATDG